MIVSDGKMFTKTVSSFQGSRLKVKVLSVYIFSYKVKKPIDLMSTAT